jgi:hypothetical protein
MRRGEDARAEAEAPLEVAAEMALVRETRHLGRCCEIDALRDEGFGTIEPEHQMVAMGRETEGFAELAAEIIRGKRCFVSEFPERNRSVMMFMQKISRSSQAAPGRKGCQFPCGLPSLSMTLDERI